MARFIHSADWQLGARFKQFGTKGDILREARLPTLRRALEFAQKKTVDAFLIAGDLFEDNQVEATLVATVIDLFREFPSVPIYILPGNHDPITGPESVWKRKPFAQAPGHIHVLTEPGITELGKETFLVASPLQQKLSTIDPSLLLVELARSLPATAIKVGITHGALAIEGKHQANDFPIALNAASRAELDYLAIGHWHNWLSDTDGGRIVMPGTPEPDQFDQSGSGNVALVEIPGPGQLPKVEPVHVAGLGWRSLTLDFLSLESSQATLEATIREISGNAAAVVLRLTLMGATSPETLEKTRSRLEELVAPFLAAQIVDRTTVSLTETELLDLRAHHPILAQVLSDIDRIETLATGVAPAAPSEPDFAPLTLAEAQEILSGSKIGLSSLSPEFFAKLRQVLLQNLQEVAK
ncbi:MAG: DNA repair exonuclease [Terrimicrobiaceae bacterium]|nr:DNA repair exonuclease [Terrimicrobiaceae bacterium]